MTRTIKQFGDPWNPYGVQLWADDEQSVNEALKLIQRIADELERRGVSHTIRLRNDDVPEARYGEMSWGAAYEAMRCGQVVTRPAFDGEPVSLQSRVIYRAGKPWLPDHEDHAALDWMVV